MSELANKTFFKFLFGFLAIISISFLMISFAGYYSKKGTTAQVVEDCQEGDPGC